MLNKVPNSKLEEWDATHDVIGKEISGRVDSNSGSGEDGVIRQRVVNEKGDDVKEV